MTLISYLIALFFTLAIEVLVAYLLGNKNLHQAIIIILINLITHPLVCYLIWINSIIRIVPFNYFSIAIAELLIVLVESLLLNKSIQPKYSQALKLSLCANTASFLLGIIIF